MDRPSERRLVTCVFIDVVGSTALTDRLGPERTRRLLSESFAEISAIGTAEGATIEKYIGDEIFMLFGAPVGHSDDVARALRTAVGCLRKMDSREALAVRIGIETGEALIDLNGVDEHQRMAVGTCVNVAARLQAKASSGEIVVGPICRVAAESIGEFSDLGELDLKGVGMVRASRLIGLTEPTDVALPFVGRAAELARLEAAFARASGGTTTLVLVSGEPGIGKTRLVEEFVGSVGTVAKLRRARFRPGTEVGLSPLSQLLTDVVVADLPASVAHSAGLVSDPRLVALPLVDRRNEIYVGWRDHFASLAQTGPVVMLLEDVQWAESEFVRLIDRLTIGSDSRLMVLATARPEFPAMTAFRPGADHLIIELGRLDAEAADALARAAGDVEISRVRRAAGHPLFITELVRVRTAISGEVPVSVQAAIGARLDELAHADRDLLQRAAVVGETFTVRDAALLADRDPAEAAGMLGRLAHLRHLDAIDGSFRFHHSLVRDVAYGRLPVATRMRLHARFAREGLPAEQVGAVAHHWWEALAPPDAEWVWEGDAELPAMRSDALRSHLAAGKQLAERLASDRAFEIFERALTLAASDLDRAEVETAFAYGLARNAIGDKATERRLHAIALFRSAGARIPPQLYADTLDLAVFNWGYFQHLPPRDQMVALIEEGTAAARAEGDAISLVRLLGQRGFFTNDRTVLTEIDPILATVGDKRRLGDVLWRLALVHLAANDDCARAVATLDLAFELAAQGGASFNEPEARAWHVIALFHMGDLDRAEASADRLLELSATKAAHTRQHALATKALVRFARGDWTGIEQLASELRRLVDANPDASWCVLGANVVGYEAIAGTLQRRAPSDDPAALVERMLPETPATRAAVLFLPSLLAGLSPREDEARRSYARETIVWERESVWDVARLNLLLGNLAMKRWAALEHDLDHVDRLAASGARFAEALASAVREEIEATRGGPKPRHDALETLGYRGISDLVAFCASDRAAAVAR